MNSWCQTYCYVTRSSGFHGVRLIVAVPLAGIIHGVRLVVVMVVSKIHGVRLPLSLSYSQNNP